MENATNHKKPWTNYIGLAVLLLAYGISIVHMFTVHSEQYAGEVKVIRLTHWQLEKGIREGLDEIARRFEKRYFEDTGERVKIVQNAISERAYRQYVQTQCIGRTAPDLIEIGKYDATYTQRFFLTNTEDIQKPNPYNKGTELEGVPWADTYRDGMQGSLDTTTLEYYGAGLSTFSVRLFYNMDLMKRVTGSDNPPKDFRGFLETCEKFKQWAKRENIEDFVPIAGANYQLGIFRSRYMDAALFDFAMKHDGNFDGKLSFDWDVFDRYVAGDFDYDDPAIRAGHKMLARITEYFPAGFMAVDRMESGFRFTQGNAAFITSGSWDAMSYFIQSDFPVGVMDFPLPSKDDPEFGKFIRGRVAEGSFWSGLRLGITKFSKHPEVALAFLQFATTKQNNEDFNRICKWIPLIHGSKTDPVMEVFIPRSEGYWGAMPFGMEWSGRMMLTYDQTLWQFVEQEIGFDELSSQLTEKMPAALAVDFERRIQRGKELNTSINAPISWHLATVTFADDWGLSEAAAKKKSDRSTMKLNYLWDGRSGSLWDSYWVMRWEQYLARGLPRALKVKEHMTLDIDEL